MHTRETVAIVMETLLRYGTVVFLLFWLLGVFVPDTTAVIGGAGLVVVIGDFVTLRPVEVTGFVEELGARPSCAR